MKRLFTCALSIILAACTNLSNAEKSAITQKAIADARESSKEIHFGYLNCYPLEKLEKDNCKRQIKNMAANRKDAISWDYILPFDFEAERIGFVAFLHEQKKICSGINQGPQFSDKLDGYGIDCTDGNHYIMRFDYDRKKWELG